MHGAASPFVPGWPPLSPHELYQQSIQGIKPFTSVTPPTVPPLNADGYSGRHVDKRYSPGLPNYFNLPGSMAPKVSPLYNKTDYHKAALSPTDQHVFQKHHTSLTYTHSKERLGHRDKVLDIADGLKEPEQSHGHRYLNGFNNSNLLQKDDRFGLSFVSKVTDHLDSHTQKLLIPNYNITDTRFKEMESDQHKVPRDLVYKTEQTRPIAFSQSLEHSVIPNNEDVYRLANNHSLSDIRSSLPYHATAEHSLSTSLSLNTATSTAASSALISPTQTRDKDFHHRQANKETYSKPLISPQHPKDPCYSSKPGNTLNPKASKIAAEIFAEAQSSMAVNKLPPFSNISNTFDKTHHGYSPYDFDSSERAHVDPRLENKLEVLKSPPSFNHWSEFNTVAPNVSLDQRTNSVVTHLHEKPKQLKKTSNKTNKTKKEGSNNHPSMKELVEKKRAEKSKRTTYYDDPKINELVDAKVQAILSAFREKEHQKLDVNVKSVPDKTPPITVSSQSDVTIINKQDFTATAHNVKYNRDIDSFNGVKPKSDHRIEKMINDDNPVREDLYQQVLDMRLHKKETLAKSHQGPLLEHPNLCGEDKHTSDVIYDLSRKTPTQGSMSLHEQVNEMRMHRKLFESHTHSNFNQHTSEKEFHNSNKNASDIVGNVSQKPIQQNPSMKKTDHLVSHVSQGELTLHQQVDEMRHLKRERHASNESVNNRLGSDSKINSVVTDKGLNLSLKKDPYEFDDFHIDKQTNDQRKMLLDIRKQNGFNSSYEPHKDSGQHIKSNQIDGMKVQNYGHYKKNDFITDKKQHYHSNLTSMDMNGENKLHTSTHSQKPSQGHLYNKKLGSKPFGYKSSLTLLKKSHKYHGKLSHPIKKSAIQTKVKKPGRPPGRPAKIKNEVKDKFSDDLMKNLGFPPLTKADLKSHMSQKIKLLKNGHILKDSSEILHKTTIPQPVIKSAEKRTVYPDGSKCVVGIQQKDFKVKQPSFGVTKQQNIKSLPRPKSVDSALSNYSKLKPARRPRSLSFDGTNKHHLLKGGIRKESVCDKLNGALSNHQREDVDFITHHVQNLQKMVTGQLEDYSHELETNTVRTVPQCGCLGMDKMFNEAVEGPYYTHLGAGRSVDAVRKLLEKRTGNEGKSIRIEKLRYTAKEGKSSQGCPIAKWIIRRSAIEEKYLALVRHRPGHFCETAWLIIGLVAWEGVPTTQADDLYSYLTETLPENGFETERRCGTNDRKTCACQGIDLKRQGASFSFGCSWSMYFNGCKFARSQTARKFKLKDATKEPLLEDKLQNLATHLAPLYKQCAPQAHFNQCYYSEKAGDCRLGNESQGPFSGVTACADFCAHAHKDIHNMNNGSTVVVTLTKHRGLSKPEDEQLHVLPLYVLEPTDEYGSYDGQYDKIQNGSLEVLHHYPLEARVRSHPLESCRKRRQNKQSPGKKRGRPFRQPPSPWSGSTSSNQSTPKKGKFSRDHSFLHSQDSSQSSGSQGGTPVKYHFPSQGGTPVKHHFPNKTGFLERTPVKQHTHLNSGSHSSTQLQHSKTPSVSDSKQKANDFSHAKRFPPGFEGLYNKFWDYFEIHGAFPPPAFMTQYARACQMMNSNQGVEHFQNNSQQLPPSYQEATSSQNRSQYPQHKQELKASYSDEQSTSHHQRSVQCPVDQPARDSLNSSTHFSHQQEPKTGSEQPHLNYPGCNREENGSLLQNYQGTNDKSQNGSQLKNYQGTGGLQNPSQSQLSNSYQTANELVAGSQEQLLNHQGTNRQLQNGVEQLHHNNQGIKEPHTVLNYQDSSNTHIGKLPSYQQAINSQHGKAAEGIQTSSNQCQNYQEVIDSQSEQKQTDSLHNQSILQTDKSLERSQQAPNISGHTGYDETSRSQTYNNTVVSSGKNSFEQDTPHTTVSQPPHYPAADNIQTHSGQTMERQQVPSCNDQSPIQHHTHTFKALAHNEYSSNNLNVVSKTLEQNSTSNISSESSREYQVSQTYDQSFKRDQHITNYQPDLNSSSSREQHKVAYLDSQSRDLSTPSVTVTDPFSDNMSTYIPDQNQVINKQSSLVQGTLTSGTNSSQLQHHHSLSGIDQTSHKGSKDAQQTTAMDLSSTTSNIRQNLSSGSHTSHFMYNQGNDLFHQSSVSQQDGTNINQSPLSLLADAVSARTNEVERKEDPFTSIKNRINSDHFSNSSNSHVENVKNETNNEMLNGLLHKTELLSNINQVGINSLTSSQDSGPHSKILLSNLKHNSYQHNFNKDSSRVNGIHKDNLDPLDPWRNEFHNFHANEQKSSKMSWNMFNYNSPTLPSQNNPSAMFNGQFHFNENKAENSIDPDVKCHMEYNEEAFRDPNIGGVAVALCHGAVLFEVAKRELHATTGLKNPNRFRPTRISLVFYQHKNLNNERHGMYTYAKKIENMKLERIERMREQQGFVDMEEIENSFKGGKKRKLDDLKQTDEEFDIMKTSAIHFRNMLECEARREMSVTTSSYKTNWVKPEPMVTGPYQKWV